jgi:hypothetical protein
MENRFPLNSLLISLIMNLALLLVLSLLREHVTPPVVDSLTVEFTRVSQERPLRRASITLPREVSRSDPTRYRSTQKDIRITRKIDTSRGDTTPAPGVEMNDSFIADSPSAFEFEGRYDLSLSASNSGRGGGLDEASHTGRSGLGGEGIARKIASRKPKALITGSGDKLSGYYNISLVRYEDTSDVISTDALKQLAIAMNRWTDIRTKVMDESLMLDDPELLQVPMVYITSLRAFAFSQRERRNLREYLERGGFLLFSNAGDSSIEKQGVANSIEFELWKLMDESFRELMSIDKGHGIYRGFFDLKSSFKLQGFMMDNRAIVVYENSGYGTAWSARDDDETYLKLGVNIIIYALTTSPMVMRP